MSESRDQAGVRRRAVGAPASPAALYGVFRFESDELTADSEALVPEILRAVGQRPVPEVVVTGHTDTTGTSASNFELG